MGSPAFRAEPHVLSRSYFTSFIWFSAFNVVYFFKHSGRRSWDSNNASVRNVSVEAYLGIEGTAQ